MHSVLALLQDYSAGIAPFPGTLHVERQANGECIFRMKWDPLQANCTNGRSVPHSHINSNHTFKMLMLSTTAIYQWCFFTFYYSG